MSIAVLKLCAIAVGPGAVVSLLVAAGAMLPCLGQIAVMVVIAAIYFAVIDELLQLETPDTWAVLVTVVVMKGVATFVVWGLMMHTL